MGALYKSLSFSLSIVFCFFSRGSHKSAFQRRKIQYTSDKAVTGNYREENTEKCRAFYLHEKVEAHQAVTEPWLDLVSVRPSDPACVD